MVYHHDGEANNLHINDYIFGIYWIYPINSEYIIIDVQVIRLTVMMVYHL